MGYLPHPSMPIGAVRPNDIIILLVIGAVFELVTRYSLVSYRRKPNIIRQRESALKELEQRVKKSRALGPHAFVETSKLERQLLAEKKKAQRSGRKTKESVGEGRKIDWKSRYGPEFRRLSLLVWGTCYGIFGRQNPLARCPSFSKRKCRSGHFRFQLVFVSFELPRNGDQGLQVGSCESKTQHRSFAGCLGSANDDGKNVGWSGSVVQIKNENLPKVLLYIHRSITLYTFSKDSLTNRPAGV
mmetsp:Transcript_13687/g.28677  ORF Transcript_13687/g.28677 Transcript_13687/m.28677 type:complete len:243 (-) Transcript_13687:2954-3682(-)